MATVPASQAASTVPRSPTSPSGFMEWNVKFMMNGPLQKFDHRTKLHLARSKKLIESMNPCTPEEIGSTAFLKKVNALAVIVNQRSQQKLCQDSETLHHFAKHNKITVLVHDIVLIALWRDEILPKLIEELNEEATTFSNEALASQCVVHAVLNHAVNGLRVMSAYSLYPEVLSGLGSGLLDLIDYAVGELRYFITNKPDDHDPTVRSCSANMEREVKSKTLNYDELCLNAFTSVRILNNFSEEAVVERLPEEVFIKLFHPDTKFLITLADMILTRPWCYSKGKYAIALSSEPSGHNQSRRRHHKAKNFIEPLEAATWILLGRVLVLVPEKFPLAFQMTQECYDKLLALRVPVKENRLAEKMSSVMAAFKSFLNDLASKPCQVRGPEAWDPVPPSPYYVSIRADLEVKTEAIVKIHTAMDTFQPQNMPDLLEKLWSDETHFSLASALDMNKVCFYCAKTESEVRCSRCQYAYYCDKKCQSKDWWKHKPICSPPSASDN